jgi:nucleoside-diphosphate-sugar epimerase
MKCVITGGCGFLGSHIATELEDRGLDVVILDRLNRPAVDLRRSKLLVGDIRDKRLLASTIQEASYIFHLSGLLGTDELFAHPAEAIDVNINGALNLLEALRSNKKLEHAHVFFPAKPNAWNNMYSVTAQAVEKMGHAYRDAFGVDTRILRLWNIYGPRQAAAPVRKVVPLFVLQARNNLPMTIFGDGAQAVQLCYVEDAAKIVVDFTTRTPQVSTTYDLAGEQSLSVIELAHLIREKMQSASVLENHPGRIGERSSSTPEVVPDVLELLGPRKWTSLQDGLQKTIEWYSAAPQELSLQILATLGRQRQ